MFRQIEVALSPKSGVNFSGDGSPPALSGAVILPLPPGGLPPASGGRSGAIGGHFSGDPQREWREEAKNHGKCAAKTAVELDLWRRSGDGGWGIKVHGTEEMENFTVEEKEEVEDLGLFDCLVV